jgi:hypothetical protein
MTKRHEYAEAFELLGGPAFPISIPGVGDNGAYGMSLRDWFAGHAMAAALGNDFSGAEPYIDRVATAAYEMADAMLRARKTAL